MKPSRLAWEYVVAQNNNNFRLNGLNPLAYLGVNPVTPVPFFSKATDPTSTDYANFILGTIWLNTANENIWMLVALTNFQGTWVKLGTSSGNLETLTGNSGGVVSPDGSSNINVVGDGTTITVVGNPATHTLTISALGTGIIETLTGDSGGAIAPVAGNINVKAGTSTLNAGSSVTIAGSGNTLLLDVTDANDNTIIGNLAGKASISGAENTGVGSSVLSSLTTGNNNIAIGSAAGADITTGTGNILIGVDSGEDITTGSYNIFLGPLNGTPTLSGVLSLGDFTNTTSAYIAGVAGVSVSNENLVTINTATGQLGSTAGGGGGFSYVTVTLTSAQIKALHATPITIIPAPAAGQMILVNQTLSQLNYGGSNAFVNAGSQSISLFYGNNTGSGAALVMQSAQIPATSSQIYVSIGAANGASTGILATAIVASQQSTTEISGNAANDNTIKVDVWYQIITP